MKTFGLGINNMMLGLLVLSISLLVYDAIVGIDATNNLLVYGILIASLIVFMKLFGVTVCK